MAKDAFTEEQQQKIREAIQEAESNTSGEIKVHIENHCKEEVLDRAAFVFEKLEMHKTKMRNGVLFYLAMKDHHFAILGDAGINEKVPQGFWDEISSMMLKHFKAGDYTEGMVEGVKAAGLQLKTHFPYDQKGSLNELSDDISFGKDK
tara:strand:+ start:1941 stop:2384 length:444 start_codon:yes stop_codon:yes gene_type:complete